MEQAKLILVVEDDQGLNDLICKKLNRSGMETKGVRSGQEALNTIKKNTYDLLIMDYQLPGMDGKTLAETMKRKGLEIPFITITGHGDEKVAVEMMKAGAADYLVKDAEFLNILPEKVKKALTELETRKELARSREDLSESEARSKKILDSMTDPVYIASATNHIQYANPALLDMAGKSELQGQCHQHIFHSDQPCQNCPSFTSLKEKNASKAVSIRLNGETKSFQISITPINYIKGTISRLHILRDVTELVRTRENAKRSERKYKLLADNAVDVVWQMNMKLHFIYLSPSATQVMGYEQQEMIGQPLWKFARRRDFVKMARLALSAIKQYMDLETVTFESVLIHKEGREIPVEITGKLLKDTKGKVIGLQGSTKDISERIQAQSSLAEQHGLLRTLIDNMPDQIYIKDRASRYLLNNVSHQKELHTSSQEEILEKSDFDFFDEELASEFYRDEQKIIKSGIPMVNKEEFVEFRDGSHKWQLVTKVPILDNKGDIAGIAGINRDITDRKNIEEELLRSRYNLALRNTVANIFLTVEKENVFPQILGMIQKEFMSGFGVFGYVNDEQDLVIPSISEDLKDQPKSKNRSLCFSKEHWQGIWASSLLERRSIIKNEALELLHGDINLDNAMSVPILARDKPLGLICIGNKTGNYQESDRNTLEIICSYLSPILAAFLHEERAKNEKEAAYGELKIAKEKAEESDKLKTAFLLNLSHELRTPLNAIMGFSRLIAEKTKDHEETSTYSEQIDMAGNDLMTTIEDTMEMAKLQSGQVRMQRENKEIGYILSVLRKEHEISYAPKYPDIAFDLKDETGDRVVFTDHEKLCTAMKKLLDNAVKFTQKGSVKVGAYLDGQQSLILYVSDTGIGIPADKHAVIFEKFTKLEDPNILHRGNGLGLSICKGLIEGIGGNICVESAPGKGTKMMINLPQESKVQTLAS